MKKLLTILLALAMLACVPLTVGAEEYTTAGDTDTTVTYSVSPTFTVTIPQSVTLGEDATIEAENVVVAKGKQVEVSISDANGFTATTAEGAVLTYTVMNGTSAVAEGETVLAVNPTDGKTGSTTLSFVAPETVQYAGVYTGTVTFTVAVKDARQMISFKFYEDGTNYWSGDGEDYVVYTVLEGTTWGEWLASADNVYDLMDGEECIYAPGPAFLEYMDEAAYTVWPLVDDEIIADAVYGLGRY